jgi:hypothetical protein
VPVIRAQPAGSAPDFEQWLAGGGDERIAIDLRTGRTRYGTPRGMARDEAWFSSSTATAISPRGHDAALQAFRSLVLARDPDAVPAWFARIRARLNSLFGIPGSDVVLAASGTELELIALALAQRILPPPLTNLVIAPQETGSGVMLAASGRHFLGSAPFSREVERGALLAGFDALQSRTETVEIRDAHGMARTPERIDDDVVAAVTAGMHEGRSALIHLLDCSKTGGRGPRRAGVSALLERFAERMLVVVDSCQLRCAPEQVRADLRAGFMVMITGSKFAAGPPFCGALLLPPGVTGRLTTFELSEGLSAYTAAQDWPASLRAKIRNAFAADCNFGAGLRWEAALAELEKLFGFAPGQREMVARAAASAIQKRIGEDARLELVDGFDDAGAMPTIFPILTAAHDTPAAAEAIRRALRTPMAQGSLVEASYRPFHVGQPVAVGTRAALRVCLSASHFVDALERMASGQALAPALAPLLADIEDLFGKWALAADSVDDRAG